MLGLHCVTWIEVIFTWLSGICQSLLSEVKYFKYVFIIDYFVFSIYTLCCPFTLYSGDDITSIQQEITMMKECKHKNIVAYYGTYHRYGNVCALPGISPVVVRACFIQAELHNQIWSTNHTDMFNRFCK